MCNLVGMYIDAPQTVTQAAQDNLVVRASGATLQGMTVSGDLVLADGIGTGDATLEKMTVDGRLIVRGGGADSILSLIHIFQAYSEKFGTDGEVSLFSSPGRTEMGGNHTCLLYTSRCV